MAFHLQGETSSPLDSFNESSLPLITDFTVCTIEEQGERYRIGGGGGENFPRCPG